MIQRVLEHESAIARMEQEVKQKQKEETKQFLLNFKNRANEFNSNDKLRERLIEEENARQWERRE
jgi:fatty acid-binding protein DegV